METEHPISPTINALPDELLLKIIQYVAYEKAGYFGQKMLLNHHYLIDVISTISKRFKNIAADNVLWNDEVCISLDEKVDRTMRRVIDCMGKNTLKLKFYDPQKFTPLTSTSSEANISSEDIISLTKKVTNLRRLELCGLELVSWPMLPRAWSLEVLILRDVNMPWNMFQAVAIHRCLPNLNTFSMIRCVDSNGTSIMLPDMSECQHLVEVRITGSDNGVEYRFPTDLCEKIPFPRGIKKLEVLNAVFEGISSDDFDQRVKAPIEKFACNCEVESF